MSQLQALFDKQKQQNEAENIAVESIGNNLNTALVDRVKELQSNFLNKYVYSILFILFLLIVVIFYFFSR